MTKTSLALAAGIVSLAVNLHAELPVGSHYAAGIEGLNSASLPPPGFYVRDYNYFYYADKVNGLSQSVDFFAYVNAVKLVYLTDYKILGANWGVDTILPFAYKNIYGQLGTSGQFSLGDIYACPLLLSWHLKQFDYSFAYGIWAPSGNYSASSPAKYLTSPGNGYWTHMITLGGVWHPDEEKTWSLSLLNRYEINTEQWDTHITPGNMFTTDFSLSKAVLKGVDVGVSGYYQQLVTRDSGPKASSDYSSVVGIGPEVVAYCDKLGLFTSLRYAYQVEAKDRPQGQTIVLTFTKGF